MTKNETKNPSPAPVPARSRDVLPPHTGSYGQLLGRRAHLFDVDTVSSLTPPFLTQREVADMLRVPERTLEDWRLTRQGPPYLKLGRHVRYELSDVIDWARSQRHG